MEPTLTDGEPAPEASGSRALSLLEIVVVGIPALILWLALAWLTTVSVPRANKLFTEFKYKTPTVTEYVLDTGWVIVPSLVLFSAVVVLLIRQRWAVELAFVLVPAIGVSVVFLSLYMPAAELVAGLRGVQPEIGNLFWK